MEYPRNTPELEESYIRAQADWIRKYHIQDNLNCTPRWSIPTQTCGWPNTWATDMDSFIGIPCSIRHMTNSGISIFMNEGLRPSELYTFPFFVLEVYGVVTPEMPSYIKKEGLLYLILKKNKEI